jgi:ring-1,2-phenylacetyl-CoA epoxidase subunit PaaD
MVRTALPDADVARRTVASVVDPEIPVLTIEDLGILREVSCVNGSVRVTVTPTYSGCPAMRQIEDDIVSALRQRGFDQVEVKRSHQPAWSTDWMTAEGKRKLSEFGIAPPTPESEVLCPRCRQGSPRMIARFGSTACKALMACSSCGEPFDLFKEHR